MACRLVSAKPLSEPCWNVVNPNLRNKIQWNLKQNSYICIHENASENGVCKMATILSQPQFVIEILTWSTDWDRKTMATSLKPYLQIHILVWKWSYYGWIPLKFVLMGEPALCRYVANYDCTHPKQLTTYMLWGVEISHVVSIVFDAML